MYNLCTIGMRGGSKGVPNKNLRELNGKPLMAYTIEQAFECKLFDHVVVTTDSKEIVSMAKNYGAEAWFLRPAEMATDDSSKIPAIRHALFESEKFYKKKFHVLFDLDVTSPLRFVEDIINAYNQFMIDDADILISANKSRKNPYFNMIKKIDNRIERLITTNNPIYNRQKAPKVYDMNASIYIWKRESLIKNNSLFTEKTSLYIMPEERSIDIDTELDWDLVEYIIKKRSS